MKKLSRSAIGLAALIFPVVAAAQQHDSTQSDSTHVTFKVQPQLDPVVVTATRVPTRLSSSTQAVTVLDGDDLRARGVTTVAQALREVPGAAVVQSGSYGGVTSLFLRGGESRYAKVLIDGVPVNTVGGQFSFENLTMDNVERIEIVRGPGSAIYGADAMTGEIQIFTKRGSGASTLDGNVRAGTYGSREGGASLRGGNDLVGYSFSGGVHRTDGILPFNNNYYNGTLSNTITVTPDSRTSIDLSSHYTGTEFHYPTDFNGTPNDSNSYRTQHSLVLGLDVARRLLPYLTLHLIGADNEVHDLSKDLTRTGLNGDSVTQQSDPNAGYYRTGELRTVATFGPLATVTLGGAYENEYQRTTQISRSGDSSIVSGPGGTTTRTSTVNTRVTHGYYASVQGTPVKLLTYDASVRYDNHSDYKNITTYHAGVNVGLLSDTRLRISYGTAFNAPAFYQSQGSAYNQPNLSLQPEQAHTVDVTLQQTLFGGRVRASVGAFDQRFSQLIQYVDAVTSGPPDFNTLVPAYYDNITEARAKGYESELHVVLLQGLTAGASYTQTIAKVYKVPPSYAGSMTAGQELLRRPSHSGNLNVAYSRSGIGSLAATAVYVGKRPDQDFSQFPSPIVTLPSYVQLGLSASIEVLHDGARSVALTGRVDNALNKRYQEVLHFQAPGRAVFVGASIAAQR